jgi:cobalt-zinc-cadmium efflux system protein
VPRFDGLDPRYKRVLWVVIGIVVWSATALSRRAPTQRFTYGLGGTSILAALFNAAFLLVIIGG